MKLMNSDTHSCTVSFASFEIFAFAVIVVASAGFVVGIRHCSVAYGSKFKVETLGF
ncbi:hypothetical protein HanRHA438_Chr08g0362741 [Helianthus annuus]|nr:hypothetical protein HanIR_Chr08g0378241 [Helianthus annuus]KAJ0898958.1 hypothetical protein HanRHA438_Chr08g0362741 [Helianthus annuus]